MGFFKNIYYFFEDKWYDVLDRINTVVPVYKIIDPIDKVAPSFILFILFVLFSVVLLGYLIQFSSTYDIKVTALDVALKKPIEGVLVSGIVGDYEEEFSEKTDSSGVATIVFSPASKNTYEILTGLLFGSNETIPITISADKNGFNSIKKQEFELESREIVLTLTKSASFVGPNFKDSESVLLVDSLTNQPIVNSSGSAYVKFRCNNKIITTKTVYDEDDGVIDGTFVLNEQKCEFMVVEAGASGYETDSVSKKIPLTNTGKFIVSLSPSVAQVPNGTAKINVLEQIGTQTVGVSGITVVLNGVSGTTPLVTNNSGVAEVPLDSGVYTITINDLNFYEVKPTDGYSVTVKKGDTNTVNVLVQRIKQEDARFVYFKVIESIDSNAISNARVDLIYLNLDSNGNYSGASSTGVVSFDSGSNNYTDSNGFYKNIGFSVRSVGSVVAIVHKDGYLYKLFKPKMLLPIDAPEVVTITKTYQSNSGSAKIITRSSDTNRALFQAKTFIYTDLFVDGNLISKIQLDRFGKLTDASGSAYYYDLEPSLQQIYSARASFENNLSRFTPTQGLDANTQIIFNIRIDVNSRYLEIELIDALTGNQINQTADVRVFTSSDSSFVSLTPIEKLVLSSGKYKSAGYELNQIVKVKISVPDYIDNFLEIDGTLNPLSIGANSYKIKLYPYSMVSDKTDIFFDDIYAGTDNVWKTNSTATVLQKAGTYYARFDVVVGKDTNYQDLLALSRTNNLANMNNIVYSKSFKENADLFTCTTTSLDTLSSHDNNYYFPTDGNVCKIEAHSNLQSGVEWKTNYLPKGTYSFAIKFTVSPTAEDNSTITINYRAKEKDTNGEFETILKEISFDLNQPLRAGVNFGAIVNSSPVELQRNQTNSNTLTGKTTPIVFPNEQNNVRFRIYNRTQTSLQNGTITAYSYKAINSISDFTTPISSTKVGISKFDSLDGNSSKVLGTNLSISAFNSKEFAFNFYPSIPNSSDWIVIVADFGANSYKIFLNTTAQGVTPIIDAEFLAGVKDQNFDGRAYDKTNRSELVTLKSVSVDVYKNCNSAGIGTLVYSGLSATLDKDYFYVTIPGVYQAGRDCLKLKVTASNSSTSYSPLVKTIFAGYGGTIDPSLACIDVTPQELSDNLTEFSIKWGASKKVIVTNNCTRPVVVKMSTGLICASPTNSNCENEVTINANEAKEYTITGTNVDYVPSSSTQPNYSDVLGLFPIQVKAKFPSVSKKFAIAQMLNAHLTNPNECFAISKDLFDFTAQNAPNKMDFNINNDCQYTLSGDYYIPKADLSIIGADLNNSVPKYSLVDFNYSLQVTSGGYTTTYLSEIQKTPVFFSKNATDVNSTIFGEVRKYSTFHFVIPTDYNGDSNRMYVKWMDVNNGALYGAKVDGNIIVNYKNGSSVSVSPRVTFDLNYPTKCVCDGHVANNTCQLSGNEDHCIIAPEISDVYDAGYDSNYRYGIAYVSFPKGSISSIDFNMIGNIDQNDLIIAARTWVYENKQVPQIIPNGNMSTENYALGRFRIYPVEGMTFILMNYGRVATSYADQIKNNYCLEHLSERAWMDNGAVYFTNTLFSNQTNASRSCTDTNFFAGQSSTLAGSIPTNILTDINSSSLNWISRDTNSGFWLSTCTVADCNVLKRTANSFVLSQSISTILGHYAPLCVTNYPTVPNSAPPTDSECNSLGIICTTNSTGKSCTLPQNLLLNTFDNSFFLNKTNPSVNVKVNSVKSGTRVLNNNSVVIWVEGGLLKATFLGEDYLPYNDGSIEFTLNNTEQLGNQYGLVNIVDYVNDGRVKNE